MCLLYIIQQKLILIINNIRTYILLRFIIRAMDRHSFITLYDRRLPALNCIFSCTHQRPFQHNSQLKNRKHSFANSEVLRSIIRKRQNAE
jgi:hypothetical protein